MAPKVLIADKLSPAAIEIFRARGIEVDVTTGLPPAELRAIIGGYDGLAIRSATKVTKAIIDECKILGRKATEAAMTGSRSVTPSAEQKELNADAEERTGQLKRCWPCSETLLAFYCRMVIF